MKIDYRQLDSGLKIYLAQTDSPLMQAQLFVPFGGDTLKYADSRLGRIVDLEPGSAHYFEHVLFIMPPLGKNGEPIRYRTNTPKTKKGLRDGLTELQNKGAISVNAYTWNDITNYWFISRKNKYENLAIMTRSVFEAYLPEDRFKAEVGTILDEERRSQNNPLMEMFSQLLKQSYQEHGARHPILGTCENIQNISLKDVLSLHETFYVPSNMTLLLTGSADIDVAAKVVEKTLALLGKNEYRAAPIEALANEPIEALTHNNFSNPILRTDIVRDSLLSAWKYVLDPREMSEAEIIDRHLSASMAKQMLFGDGSLGRERLMKSGFDESTFFTGELNFRDHGLIYVGVDADVAENTHDKLRDFAESLLNGKIQNSEFEDARGALLIEQDNTKSALDDFGSELVRYGILTGNPASYFRMLERLETITPKEVQRELEGILNPKSFSSVLARPKKE